MCNTSHTTANLNKDIYLYTDITLVPRGKQFGKVTVKNKHCCKCENPKMKDKKMQYLKLLSQFWACRCCCFVFMRLDFESSSRKLHEMPRNIIAHIETSFAMLQ